VHRIHSILSFYIAVTWCKHLFCSVAGIHKSTCADIFFGRYSQNFNNVGLKLLTKKFLNHLVYKNWQRNSLIVVNYIFFLAQQPLVCQVLLIIEDSWSHSVTHTTLGCTPLDKWSAWCNDLYLTTHNTQNRQISMPLAGFKSTTPASKWLQTHTFDWPLGQEMFTAANYCFVLNIQNQKSAAKACSEYFNYCLF